MTLSLGVDAGLAMRAACRLMTVLACLSVATPTTHAQSQPPPADGSFPPSTIPLLPQGAASIRALLPQVHASGQLGDGTQRGSLLPAPDPEAAPMPTPPARLVCSGTRRISGQNWVDTEPYTFDILFDVDKQEVRFDGVLATAVKINNDEISFIPPRNRFIRAYAAVITLGLSELGHRMTVDRKTGTFHSPGGTGTCQLSTQSENIF